MSGTFDEIAFIMQASHGGVRSEGDRDVQIGIPWGSGITCNIIYERIAHINEHENRGCILSNREQTCSLNNNRLMST